MEKMDQRVDLETAVGRYKAISRENPAKKRQFPKSGEGVQNNL